MGLLGIILLTVFLGRDFPRNGFLENSKFFVFGWGALPPRPAEFWLGGQSRPRPLNGRPQHLIEAAKRGRLDQMLFFSALWTIRAPLTTWAPQTTVRQPEAKCTSVACRMRSFNFLQSYLYVTMTGTCTSDRGVPEIKGFSGRSAGRPAGRSSAAQVSSAAPKKKAFDRGGPVWPPR